MGAGNVAGKLFAGGDTGLRKSKPEDAAAFLTFLGVASNAPRPGTPLSRVQVGTTRLPSNMGSQ